MTLWLLQVMISVMDAAEKASEIEMKNFSVSLTLVKKFLETEFTLCLLYIGKAEDKDTHDKILNISQQVSVILATLIESIMLNSNIKIESGE